jgi:hypothetical protein
LLSVLVSEPTLGSGIVVKELGTAPLVDDRLGWLTVGVQLPTTLRILVRRVKSWLF